MKTILFMLALLLVGLQQHGYAQNNQLNVYKSGTQSTYDLNQVDSVVYVDICKDLELSMLFNGTDKLNFSATGGLPPYEYSLNGYTWQNSGQFTMGFAFDSVAWVRDANGCVDTLELQKIDLHFTFLNTKGNKLHDVQAYRQGQYVGSTSVPIPFSSQLTKSYTMHLSYFSLPGSSPILEFRHNYHTSKYYIVDPSKGQEQHIDIMMHSPDSRSLVDVSSINTIRLNTGSSVELPANGVEEMNGGAYSNPQMNVAVKEISKSQGGAFHGLIPGGTVAALDASANQGVLHLINILGVVLESTSSSTDLQLKANQTATLTFVIPEEYRASAPSSIALWYFDESVGLWKEEGSATKVGNTYVGTVTHFTYWSIGAWYPSRTVTGCIVDLAGDPVPFTNILVNQLATTTNSNGCFSVVLPAGQSQHPYTNVSYYDVFRLSSCLIKSTLTFPTVTTTINLGNLLMTCPQGALRATSILWGMDNQANRMDYYLKSPGGSPLTNETIQLQVVTGGGTLSSTSIVTDNQGHATVDWTWGSGAQRIEAIWNNSRIETTAERFDTMVDPRDGQVYKTVNINGVIWMAENMNYDVPGVSTDTITNPSFLDTVDIDTFYSVTAGIATGRLYDMTTAQTKVCPSGWHLAHITDFTELELFLGIPYDYTFYIPSHPFLLDVHGLGHPKGDWSDPSYYTNVMGFSGLPSPIYDAYFGIVMGGTKEASYWVDGVVALNDPNSISRHLESSLSRRFYSWLSGHPTYGYSCRCVKD